MPATKVRSVFTTFRSLPAWGAWGIMLITSVAFVLTYGSNVPSWDGWDMVPALTGHQPVTLEWLWSQHNEHRVPLPRLTTLLLLKLTGLNLKVEMVFNVLLMAVLAFAMMRTAGRLRGQISWTDAFFPLVLLNLGHATNFLWAWQIQYFLSAFLCGLILLILLKVPERLPPLTAAIGVGGCLIALILCGANGLAVVPVLLAWMAYVAFTSPGERYSATRIVVVAVGVLTLLLAVWYFVGYEPVPYHPAGHGIRSTLRTGLQILTFGLAPGLYHLWPWSGMVTVLVISVAAFLLFRKVAQGKERDRALALLTFLSAIILLSMVIGYGRDSFSLAPESIDTKFVYEIRYYVLIVPVWCAVYMTFSLFAPDRSNYAVRTGLCLAALLLLWPNTRLGLAYGKSLKSKLETFEEAMRAGTAPHLLISRHWVHLHVNHEILQDYLPMLRAARVGAFAHLTGDPGFRKVSIPREALVSEGIEWRDDTAHFQGYGAFIGYVLPAPRLINGIYLRFVQFNPERRAPFRMVWWSSRAVGEVPPAVVWEGTGSRHFYQPTGDYRNWHQGTWLRADDPESTAIIWVNDTLQELRIYPDLIPGTFYLAELELLTVPDSGSNP